MARELRGKVTALVVLEQFERVAEPLVQKRAPRRADAAVYRIADERVREDVRARLARMSEAGTVYLVEHPSKSRAREASYFFDQDLVDQLGVEFDTDCRCHLQKVGSGRADIRDTALYYATHSVREVHTLEALGQLALKLAELSQERGHEEWVPAGACPYQLAEVRWCGDRDEVRYERVDVVWLEATYVSTSRPAIAQQFAHSRDERVG